MLGLQGKSAKPAPRTSFSKSARPNSTMATTNGSSNRSRASSNASERPERLSLTSRGPSPYTSKITAGVPSGTIGSATSRRVQSAATSRQKSALGGPTIKASEFFRKNHSEPQLSNTNNNSNHGTVNKGKNDKEGPEIITSTVKNVKHVRIDTDRNSSSSPSLKTTLNTAANLLGIRGTNPFYQGTEDGCTSGSPNRRRPFSFSSDRSRSVSVTSTDSCSTFDDANQQDNFLADGGGDGQTIYWKKDYENNNSKNNININKNNHIINSDSGKIKVASKASSNPQLSKRSYSMDAYDMVSDQEDNFWDSPSPQEFRAQRLEMKIAEHPEETLKENNITDMRVRRDSMKSQLNRTFTEEDESIEEPKKVLGSSRCSSQEKCQAVKGSDFDRMLLMQSDNLLQGVNELINEIKSTETSKKLKNSVSISKSDSVEIEKLVADLRNDMNKQMHDSVTLSLEKADNALEQQQLATVDEGLNFSTLSFSGIELSDITCPSQVMEQSVPNTGRTDDRPLSAIVLGNDNDNSNKEGKVETSFISEAESYLKCNKKMNRNAVKSSIINNTDDVESSSSSNNQMFCSPDALSIIEQQVNSRSGSARSIERSERERIARDASSPSQHSGFDISQEEIQRRISSALKLLEEEDKKRNSSRRASLTSREETRSQSPFLAMSNPGSRSASRGAERGTESARGSPQILLEQRNIHYDVYDSHPMREHGVTDMVSSQQSVGKRNISSEPQSARSCSCLIDHFSNGSLHSARSSKTNIERAYHSSLEMNRGSRIPRPDSGEDRVDLKDDKTKEIFSFLDEVEKSDQEMLFGLRFETDCIGRPKGVSANAKIVTGINENESVLSHSASGKRNGNEEGQFRTMDSLIRKGSVELAREILLLERRLDEAQHAVKLLEESLLNQRELNIRNLRNSERDFKKRMKMQKEEFDLAFSRNEALINEMATEKRVLQDKLDKLIKNFEEMEEKHKEHTKSMQQKHLDEIRRLRKMQQNAENSLKKSIAGNKTQAQEIREMTVKGLEPEVQRIIQRHQQEMSEMRAWHADEVREIEERYQRKLHMQLEDLRQKFAKEKEDLVARENELAHRRIQAELKQKDDELENLKRRHANEMFEERERAVCEEMKLKESIQEAVRKVQIKGEVELENLKQDYETKIANLERRHENELKSIKDVFDAERQNWATNQMKKLEQALAEQEAKMRETLQNEKEKEWRERERKLREDFEKSRKDDETTSENRFRRMQEKYQSELDEMEKTEKDVKAKFSQAKTDLLAREEEVFALKASISMKDKQLTDLQEANLKMQEERVNLTSVIRKEFSDQIQSLEEECRSLKATIVEIQSSCKLQIEHKQLEIEKIVTEKDSEVEKIGLRVKQALSRKDETIMELQKQLDKSAFQISHLEELLEEQRKEFLHGMTKMPTSGGRGHRK